MLNNITVSALFISGMLVSTPPNIFETNTNNYKNIYNYNDSSSYVVDNQIIITSNGHMISKIDDQLNKNLSKLDIFQNFEENWNGYESVTFSFEFIQKIKNILYFLPKQPQMFPISYGNIQFEYELKDGSYLEFEISPDMNINMLFIDSKGNEIEKEIKVKDISQEVSKFYGIL